MSLEEVTVQDFSAFPYRITDLKSFFKCYDKLLQWNKQTVVEHYRFVLHNDFLIIIMKWLHRYSNDTEILTVFKKTELSRCCPKQIIHEFQLLQRSCRWRAFRSLFKGTLMQIWKSGNIFVFTWKQYVEDFTLKHLLRFAICAHDLCGNFVYKHSETIWQDKH